MNLSLIQVAEDFLCLLKCVCLIYVCMSLLWEFLRASPWTFMTESQDHHQMHTEFDKICFIEQSWAWAPHYNWTMHLAIEFLHRFRWWMLDSAISINLKTHQQIFSDYVFVYCNCKRYIAIVIAKWMKFASNKLIAFFVCGSWAIMMCLRSEGIIEKEK